MKKWIVSGIIVLFLVVCGAVAYSYNSIRTPLDEQYARAEAYAINEAGLHTITDITYYHGTNTYYVVTGSDTEQEQIIWIPDDFQSHHMEAAADGITKQQALEIAASQVDIDHVQAIRLGFERQLPVYEVTYINSEGNQAYYYMTFADGTFMKRYQLRVG
ncbi:cell wall elongation regulator TseB-like domain-containing protein [Halalkalibacter oceani]|uniref:cell wall elongation regulator TseB-like domain-containing protein n=1 Tax=Halalkalibacter oceani TaxID=1653776 RepID=UPI0033930675